MPAEITVPVGLPGGKVGKVGMPCLIGQAPGGQLTERIASGPCFWALLEGNVPPPGMPDNKPVKKWFVDGTPLDRRIRALEEAQHVVGILHGIESAAILISRETRSVEQFITGNYTYLLAFAPAPKMIDKPDPGRLSVAVNQFRMK